MNHFYCLTAQVRNLVKSVLLYQMPRTNPASTASQHIGQAQILRQIFQTNPSRRHKTHALIRRRQSSQHRRST